MSDKSFMSYNEAARELEEFRHTILQYNPMLMNSKRDTAITCGIEALTACAVREEAQREVHSHEQ